MSSGRRRHSVRTKAGTEIRRLFSAVALAGLLVGAVAVPVSAAKPNNQACLGHDVSGYAQTGSAFGAFVAGLATSTTGLGDEAQLFLAGLLPDSVMPNTCNDD
jgi:hypothetical protein